MVILGQFYHKTNIALDYQPWSWARTALRPISRVPDRIPPAPRRTWSWWQRDRPPSPACRTAAYCSLAPRRRRQGWVFLLFCHCSFSCLYNYFFSLIFFQFAMYLFIFFEFQINTDSGVINIDAVCIYILTIICSRCKKR